MPWAMDALCRHVERTKYSHLLREMAHAVERKEHGLPEKSIEVARAARRRDVGAAVPHLFFFSARGKSVVDSISAQNEYLTAGFCGKL